MLTVQFFAVDDDGTQRQVGATHEFGRKEVRNLSQRAQKFVMDLETIVIGAVRPVIPREASYILLTQGSKAQRIFFIPSAIVEIGGDTKVIVDGRVTIPYLTGDHVYHHIFMVVVVGFQAEEFLE